MAEKPDSSPPAGAERGHLPSHIAVIMDGNGRWAKSRGLPRIAGHKRGAETLRSLLECCVELGLPHLTVYAFSSENWNRPAPEVSELMELLRFYLRRELQSLHRNGIRLRIIGDRSQLAKDILGDIEAAEALTHGNSALQLNVALSYGGRQEILRAVRRLASDIAEARLEAHSLTQETVERYLDTSHIPDPDLLIRTGGEQRLSNFLLWQSAYTELYFTQVLWPDFTTTHFMEALNDYYRRERRYGTTEG